MLNTIFESGGKCPPLLIIRGADVLIYHFHRGANVRGGKCPTLLYTELRRKYIPIYFLELIITTNVRYLKNLGSFIYHALKSKPCIIRPS